MSATVLPFRRPRRCAPAQHGRAPTRSRVQHGPIVVLDEVLRALGPRGFLRVSGDGRRVLECSEPVRGGAA